MYLSICLCLNIFIFLYINTFIHTFKRNKNTTPTARGRSGNNLIIKQIHRSKQEQINI